MKTIGPYSSKKEISKFLENGKSYLNTEWVEELLHIEKQIFYIEQLWQDHNPLKLVINKKIHTDLLYLSCADKDQYGFYEGTKLFASLAKKQKTKVIWHPTHGGHCVTDPKALVDFFK